MSGTEIAFSWLFSLKAFYFDEKRFMSEVRGDIYSTPPFTVLPSVLRTPYEMREGHPRQSVVPRVRYCNGRAGTERGCAVPGSWITRISNSGVR
eukprot:1367716-Rhodomonas_salina.1